MALSEIKTEFAGPNTMSSYLRGGTYVPNIAANSAVATALPLTMSTFVGAVNRTFGLAVGPIYAGSSFSVTASLIIYRNGSANSTTWTTPTETTIGDGYEVRVTATSELGLSGPARGSWHALTTNRQWDLSRSTTGVTDTALTVDIRIAGGGATVCSETIDMTAEVF
jgi:hypothetical protein